MGSTNKFSKIGMPLIIALSIVLGMYVQKNLDKKQRPAANGKIRYAATSKIESLLRYIQSDYVDSVDIWQMEEDAIPIILEDLDPHSIYIPKKDLEAMNEPLEGNFDGIGVQFNIQKDTVTVIKTIAGGPSEKVGVRDGDRIVTVNDSLIAGVGITNNQVMKLLRGKKGTQVKVGIKRRNEPELVAFTITRDAIPLYSIDVSYMIDENIGYIKLSKFSRTTYKEFQEAIAKLKAQGMKKLIFDLRSNSGGYMDAAVNIVDDFLPPGKMIVYTQGKARPRADYTSTNRYACRDIELTILIDEWSASASEIVSGAIQDNDRGKIIGRRSFGKGLVQEPVAFTDGSAMRLTTARYYTPSGRSIQKSYEGGQEEYHEDIINRYNNGEFLEQDSIHFPDSLKYFTAAGRPVYGGGGIMPDLFIPYDTSGTSEYYTKINRKGLEYQFSFEYTDKNRGTLSQLKDVKAITDYLDKQDLMDKFIKFAAKQGVKPNAQDIAISGEIIETQIKALVARNLIDNEGFYPIIQNIDQTLLESIEYVKNN